MAEELLQDFMGDFSGGQNASLDPANLPPNTYHSAVNCSVQNEVLQPRWGFRTVQLDFTNTETILDSQGLPVNPALLFANGRFQALIEYSVGPDYHLIAIMAGYMFLIHQDTFQVQVMNPTDPLNVNAARINSSPAGRFLVIFDWPSVPMIVEGLVVRRSDPTKNEVPVSVIGGYNQNVLMIGNAGNEFTFSDPAAYGFPQGPISFTLVELPSTGFTGQIFQLSTNYGNDPITAMSFLQFTDSSTGIGPALISTAKQVFSYQTQTPRSTWLNNQFGSALLSVTGMAGQLSQINLNSDLLFACADAQIRALSMSRDQQRRWGNFPISIEVSNYLLLHDKSLAQFICAGYFENKAFFGANPFRTHGQDADGNSYTDYACAGFVVMELNAVSGLNSAGQTPVWAGLWTGIRPMAMVVNNQQAFVMSKDEGYGNVLYRLDPEINYDVIRGKEQDIRSILYTRAFECPAVSSVGGRVSTSNSNKLLHSMSVSINDIQGNFQITTSYKPEHGPNYIHWRTYNHIAPVQQCSSMIDAPNGLSGHSIRDFYLGAIEDENECNPATQETYSTFKKVQIQIELIGRNWNLINLQIKATLAPQSPNEVLCEEFPPTELPLECLKDWMIYDPSSNCN